jgi:hypothetical protein
VEAEPNDSIEKAQAVALGSTVAGRVQQGEDVDYYKVTVPAAQELTLTILAARLQDKIHDLQNHLDPLIVLRDATGRALDQSDDYYRADPLLIRKFDKPGDYIVEVRDVRYQGDAGWTYLLTITGRPFVTGVLPMAVPRGKPAEVQPIGVNLGEVKAVKVEMAAGAPDEAPVQLTTASGATNPVRLIASDLSEAVAPGTNTSREKAAPLAVPSGMSGRLATEGEAHFYRFQGVKGQPLRFEVQARRYDSQLDSEITILNAQGQEVAGNDDALGKDSLLDWTPPEDGAYTLRVRDINARGGETFTYRVTATRLLPDFALRLDGDKALLGPGGGTCWYALVERVGGFAGPVKLTVSGLPAGVTVIAPTIPANMTQVGIIFTAAADAKVHASAVTVTGSATVTRDGHEVEVSRVATPQEEIYIPGGGRGMWKTRLAVVSVTEPSDITLELVPKEATVAPGGTVTIDVTVKRREGYAKGVTLDIPLRHLGGVHANPLPPGVTFDEGASKTLLSDKETAGKLVLKVAPDAPELAAYPIPILGQVSVNFVVKLSYAAPFTLTVKKP